jgi:glycosyltransferase involved in cell wall biosynthesis
MKKVLLCFKMPHGTYIGGVATIINNYLQNKEKFKANGYDIELFDYVMEDKYKKLPSKISEIVYGILQRRALKKYLKLNLVDVINIHTSREWLYVKDILLAKMIAKKYGIKVVLTIHVGTASTVYNRIRLLKQSTLKIVNRYVSKIIFLSKEIQNEFIHLGIKKEKTEVLYNPHFLSQVEDEKEGDRRAVLQLLYVGALHREKGILELLNALCNMEDFDFHVDICGINTDKSIILEFEECIQKLDKKVTLHGYVSGKEKTQLFNQADVLVLPSYHEGMPLVIMEALATGCAIISTKVGTTPEILNKENVCWVKIKSKDDIINAVENLYRNPKQLLNMKKSNFELGKKFTIERHVEKLCDIYSKMF